MNAKGIVFAAALLSIGSAQAQLVEAAADTTGGAPSSRLEAEPGRYGPLAKGFKKYSPIYGGNETANPNDRLFPGFRTDPRLVIGYALNPYLSLETGYSHLRDEGFHRIDANSAVESAYAAGQLGAKSHTTYLAAKLSVPVNERLTAYGKFGVAHSEVKNDGLLRPERVRSKTTNEFVGIEESGAYGAVGAKYKINDRATFSGEVRKNGSANSFGRASNASAVTGSIGLGF